MHAATTSGDDRYVHTSDAPVRAAPIADPDAPGAEPLAHVTAAYAQLRDAYYTVGLLESSAGSPVRARLETLYDERGLMQLALLHIELGQIPIERALTAIAGGHGVQIPAREPGASAQEIGSARFL